MYNDQFSMYKAFYTTPASADKGAKIESGGNKKPPAAGCRG